METNQFFSLPRFGHLIKREFIQNKRNLVIVSLTIFSILLASSLVYASDRDNEFYENFFPSFLLIAGFIGTSLSFTEMNKPDSQTFFLTLPASNFEKFLGRWLATGIGYIIFFLTGFWLLSKVANGLGNAIFNFNHGDFNPFTRDNKLFIQLYLAIQTIFLIGAIYFRKVAFFKTILSTVLIALFFAFFSFFLFRITMFDMFEGWFNFNPEMEINGKLVQVQPSQDFQRLGLKYGEKYLRLLGFWIIPIILLIAGYFKLKETEL